MEVFRLSRTKYADQLSGIGASLKGGRWNSKGTAIIYTAFNRSLAMAEVAVHFSLSMLPQDYKMLTIYVPDDLAILHLPGSDLPENWNSFPYHSRSQHFGDDFIRQNKFALLKVPSAVTKGDFNLLINPFHPDFDRIFIIENEAFPFDNRIFS
ncbi:MAG: RES family NAD+ phosphorylase [Bacteroidales bacterium]|jgi:RES domain-containing protein|nr:RES family NAD+ phosphorylase [Bacteroidales bacterium]